jgi:hypothetical protein
MKLSKKIDHKYSEFQQQKKLKYPWSDSEIQKNTKKKKQSSKVIIPEYNVDVHKGAKSAKVLDCSQFVISEESWMNLEDDITKGKEASVDKNNQPVQCLICCDMPADAVLMECGHGGVCF